MRKGLIFAAFFLASWFTSRAIVFQEPFWDIDEIIFHLVAQKIAHGGQLYVDAVDNKPPLIFFFFALANKILGVEGLKVMQIITFLWIPGISFFLYKIGENVFSKEAGALAAILYPILSVIGHPSLISTNIETIILLPFLASVWLILKKRLLLAGLLAGTVLFFKYQGGILVGLGIVSLLANRNWRGLLTFCIGLLGVTLGIVALLVARGEWDGFRLWSLGWSLDLASQGSQYFPFWSRFLFYVGGFVLPCAPLWLFALRQLPRSGLFMVLWFILGGVAVSAGRLFHWHYFLLWLPPMILLASAYLAKGRPGPAWKTACAFLLISLLASQAIRWNVHEVYEKFGAAKTEDHQSPYFREVAEYLRLHTQPDEKIFVWGFAPSIYYFSQRENASRFLICDLLAGRVGGAGKLLVRKGLKLQTRVDTTAWTAFWQDLEKHSPIYIVDASALHYFEKYPMESATDLKNYVDQSYKLEMILHGLRIYKRTNT